MNTPFRKRKLPLFLPLSFSLLLSSCQEDDLEIGFLYYETPHSLAIALKGEKVQKEGEIRIELSYGHLWKDGVPQFRDFSPLFVGLFFHVDGLSLSCPPEENPYDSDEYLLYRKFSPEEFYSSDYLFEDVSLWKGRVFSHREEVLLPSELFADWGEWPYRTVSLYLAFVGIDERDSQGKLMIAEQGWEDLSLFLEDGEIRLFA